MMACGTVTLSCLLVDHAGRFSWLFQAPLCVRVGSMFMGDLPIYIL